MKKWHNMTKQDDRTAYGRALAAVAKAEREA